MMTNARATEDDLLRRAQAGDSDAFGELTLRYRERLQAIAASLMAPALRRALPVEDVVQETWARGLASIGSFEWRGEGSLLRWLGTIARNVIAKSVKRDLRHAAVELGVDPAASTVSPSHGLRREERYDRLERSLAALPEEQQEVIRLAKLDGLSSAEIAAKTGRSELAVRQALSRGLRALRGRIGDTVSLGLPPRSIRNGAASDSDVEEASR